MPERLVPQIPNYDARWIDGERHGPTKHAEIGRSLSRRPTRRRRRQPRSNEDAQDAIAKAEEIIGRYRTTLRMPAK
jgi:hypothetical protein